eukprot:3822339-Lingulodinium_polyedra.AAC.1
MWPLAESYWTPPPRLACPRLATARWIHSRCSQCRDYRRTLVSTLPLKAGDAVTVPDTDCSTVLPASGPHIMVTFDGG